MRGEFLDLSGARLYYYAAGTRGAGEPVVFLHGFPTSGHLWADVVPLVPAGHRVVVVDLLGYGRSDRPLDRSLSVDAHADRVIELFDQLRIERACIVGHGLGGGIAQAIAVRCPARVSKLCLIASLDFEAWPTFGARLARLAVPAMRLLPPAALLGAVRSRLAHGYRDPDRASRSIELYLRPFASDEGRDALAAHLRALLGTGAASIAAALPAVGATTAIVWGQRDRVLPIALGHRLQRAIPGATMQVVDGRHFIPEEDPRPVAAAIAALLARG